MNNYEIEYFKNMSRCRKCILPETFPGIKFNQEKICNYCKDWEPIKVFGEEQLKNKLLPYQDKGDKYDALVPISGGRDSSYVLSNIVKKYKMRTLALTVDGGFITEEGYRNINIVTTKLGVDHVWIRDEKENTIAKKNCKIKFHGWLKKPSINTIVPVLNSGDKTMNLKNNKTQMLSFTFTSP